MKLGRPLKSAYRAVVEGVALPYVRRELPGWGPLYETLVEPRQGAIWRDAGSRILEDKLHGYEVALDMGAWSQRLTYFLGRYYDLPTQLALMRALRPGDHVFDIGANIGMLSLLAAKLVGPEGRVDAFEPNPGTCERLERTIERNGITNILLHEYGLGDRDERLTLSVPRVSSGEATLTESPYEADQLDPIQVEVRRGDPVVEELGPPDLVKIDVEGFECRVIDGMQDCLRRHKPIVITEVMSEHLARAGETTRSLFERMERLGYVPRRLGVSWRGSRHGLDLLPATYDAVGHYDVLWIDPRRDEHVDRVGEIDPGRFPV